MGPALSPVASVMAGMDPRIEWREAESNPMQASGEVWIGPDAILR